MKPQLVCHEFFVTNNSMKSIISSCNSDFSPQTVRRCEIGGCAAHACRFVSRTAMRDGQSKLFQGIVGLEKAAERRDHCRLWGANCRDRLIVFPPAPHAF